jgi:membrane protein
MHRLPRAARPLATAALRACSFALLLGFVMLGLAFLYRFAPSRADAKWRWVTPGSLLAAALWLAASLAFSFYVSNFGSYDTYYGALGGADRSEIRIWSMIAVKASSFGRVGTLVRR